MKITRPIVLGLIMFISSAFTIIGRSVISKVPLSVISKDVIIIKAEIKPIEITIKAKTMKQFLYKIGMRESSNRYDIVNKWGYAGKYQFGRKTLNSLGYKKVTMKRFLNSPEIQERAMQDLLKHNKHNLRREIRKYEGKVVHGIRVTESGLLAAAHLAGAGNVKKWIRRGTRFKDGLGTPLTEYMKLFSGYNLQI